VLVGAVVSADEVAETVVVVFAVLDSAVVSVVAAPAAPAGARDSATADTTPASNRIAPTPTRPNTAYDYPAARPNCRSWAELHNRFWGSPPEGGRFAFQAK
jgi:hypothetical protein